MVSPISTYCVDELRGGTTPGLDIAGQMGAIARMGAESVSRFTTGGHGDALATPLDVLALLGRCREGRGSGAFPPGPLNIRTRRMDGVIDGSVGSFLMRGHPPLREV